MSFNTNTQYVFLQKNESAKKQYFKGNCKQALSNPDNLVNKSVDIINNNPIVGFTAVDLISMVIPRTMIDFSRNAYAGVETFTREITANVVNAAVPFIAAYGFAKAANNLNTKITANNDTVDFLDNCWKGASDKNYMSSNNQEKEIILKKYIENIFKSAKGNTGDSFKEWDKVANNEAKQKVINDLSKVINKKYSSTKLLNKELKDIEKQITQTLGASENIKLNDKIDTSLKNLLEDTTALCKEVFTKSDPSEISKHLNKIKKVNNQKTAFGISVAVATAISVQFIIKNITKKQTGSDDFVGLPNYSDNIKNKNQKANKHNRKFLAQKALAATGILTIAAATVAGGIKQIPDLVKPGVLMNKVKFNGWFPNTNQFRIIYASLIAGRLMAARDKHELRETTLRDYTGFFNWLVLGGVVSKLVGSKLSKGKIMNCVNTKPTDSFFTKAKDLLQNQQLKTHEEILANKAILGENNVGKYMKHLNIATASGLAYSMLALGMFMPLLNKIMTNKLAKINQMPENDITPAINNNNQLSNNNFDKYKSFLRQ